MVRFVKKSYSMQRIADRIVVIVTAVWYKIRQLHTQAMQSPYQDIVQREMYQMHSTML
jgi:predicted DNA-binding protein YlxM (UPF0122 family)